MKLHFIKVNPVENMTIFVLNQIPRENHVSIANHLMDYSSLNAEQVGFIETPKDNNASLRLQMMGGEFCGNATRSLAAFIIHNEYLGIKKSKNRFIVPLEVSGINHIISCEVKKLTETNSYQSKIQMPLPLEISKENVKYTDNSIDVMRVDFPGITHFIVDKDKIKDKNKFYNIVKENMAKEEYDAFGIMYYDYRNKFMEPLVYVKATDSLFWERSCASGTCALGCALSFINKKEINEDVNQPGGSLNVNVDYEDSNITSLYLDGEVKIVAEGIVYV